MLPASTQARFGTGNDFKILHDGTDSYLDHSLGSGLLRINAAAGAEIRLTKSGPETIAKFIPDGACELYNNNSKKFETTATGATVTGALTTTGNISTAESILMTGDDKKIKLGVGEDLQIYHDGSHSYIKDVGTGELKLTSDGNGVVLLKGTSENLARFLVDGAVELYYDNAKKFETVTGGATITGVCTATSFAGDGSALTGVSSVGGATGVDFNDSVVARWGTGNDFEVYHDGTNSVIKNTEGTFYLRGDDVRIYSEDGNKTIAKFHESNSQEFYFNNSKKLEVNNTGIGVTGSITPSGGLYLGGSGGSNYLNDYEKGSWDATCDNSVTLTHDELFYTKIGRLVHVCGYLTVNSDNSNTSFIVNNLPFAGNSGFGLSAPFCRLYNWNIDSDCKWVAGYTEANKIYFQQVKDDNTNTALAADSGAIMILSLTYYQN